MSPVCSQTFSAYEFTSVTTRDVEGGFGGGGKPAPQRLLRGEAPTRLFNP